MLAEPAALRGVLKIVDASEIPDVIARFVTALQSRGARTARGRASARSWTG
jgi:hypothetical protein